MKKNILVFIKNFVLSFIFIYTLNIMLVNVDLFIPINMYTLCISTFLGTSGIVSLVILSYLI